MRLTAAILAGGFSRRMGRDKALLPVASHATLLARQLAVVAELHPIETLVSCRPEQRLPLPRSVRVVHDDGSAGPLGGIVALLRAMRGDALFVLGVDLARMTPHLARRIVGAAPFDGSRGVVPCTARGVEPLASLFPRALTPLAEEQLATRADLSLHRLLVRGVECGLVYFLEVAASDLSAFANWNHPREASRRSR